jgi:lipid II isoglutaminyl synthase (glutamine-hydrolysing)
MTDSVGRHAAAREPAETLIIPAQQGWPDGGRTAWDQTGEPGPRTRVAGRHASREPLGPALAKNGQAAPDSYGASNGNGAPNGHGAPDSHGASNGHGIPSGHGTRGGGRAADVGGLAARPEPHGPGTARRDSQLRLVWVYPDLLSTYGDRGNLLVLSRRANLRGIEVEAIEVNSDQPVPTQGDIYLLGGGEDLPQILAANRLRADGGLARAAGSGAVVFAVCAGYQVIGDRFGGVEGEAVAGLRILDISSGRGDRRGVGELVADADPALSVPRLTGFENHQGVTRIGSAARPLAKISLGVGNGDGTEGAYSGKVLGTYMHGPALVRNPGLADLLLRWATGTLKPINPADEDWAAQLRAERLAAVER